MSLIWVGIAVWQAAVLQPATEAEDPVDPEHPAFIAGFKIDEHFLKPPADKPEIYYIWGTSYLDTSS